jgi:hypothetical protein
MNADGTQTLRPRLIAVGASQCTYGGSVCESNTPRRLFTPHNGFEDRGDHQDSSASKAVLSLCGNRKANPIVSVDPTVYDAAE